MEKRQLIRPTEAKPYLVKPLEIPQSLFEKERGDVKQEETRQYILEALVDVRNNPQEYGKIFMTFMPKKGWRIKRVQDLMDYARKYDYHMAVKREQALEWAMRIYNGESWKEICNNPDTANWYRVVEWDDGYFRQIGGARMIRDKSPATDVSGICAYHSVIESGVPLMVKYRK